VIHKNKKQTTTKSIRKLDRILPLEVDPNTLGMNELSEIIRVLILKVLTMRWSPKIAQFSKVVKFKKREKGGDHERQKKLHSRI